jgi:hypothetical protein
MGAFTGEARVLSIRAAMAVHRTEVALSWPPSRRCRPGLPYQARRFRSVSMVVGLRALAVDALVLERLPEAG